MTNSDIPVSKYKEQTDKGFKFLHFEPELEAEFRATYGQKHRSKQLSTIVVGIVILLMLFPIDLETLPKEIIPLYFMCRLGIAIPLLLFVSACHFMSDLRKHVQTASLVAVQTISLGTIALYVTSARQLYHFPYEGLILILMVTFFMTGIRFRIALISAIATLGSFELASLAFIPSELRYPADSFYLLATVICGATGAYSVEYQKRKSFLQNTIVEDLATKDGLTHLYNRTAIMEKLEAVLQYAKREQKYMTLYLADIDCFKEYNDNYGHVAGDKCLVQVASTLQSCCQRSLDFAGRYGGEEFLLVWFDTKPAESKALIDRVQQKINDLRIPHTHSSAAPHITVSGGYVNLIPSENTDLESLLHQTDMALYNAKRKGRNRVVQVATPEYV